MNSHNYRAERRNGVSLPCFHLSAVDHRATARIHFPISCQPDQNNEGFKLQIYVEAAREAATLSSDPKITTARYTFHQRGKKLDDGRGSYIISLSSYQRTPKNVKRAFDDTSRVPFSPPTRPILAEFRKRPGTRQGKWIAGQEDLRARIESHVIQLTATISSFTPSICGSKPTKSTGVSVSRGRRVGEGPRYDLRRNRPVLGQ